jgi:hypothetical protein
LPIVLGLILDQEFIAMEFFKDTQNELSHEDLIHAGGYRDGNRQLPWSGGESKFWLPKRRYPQ